MIEMIESKVTTRSTSLKLSLSLIAGIVFLASSAAAEKLPRESVLPLSLATKAAQAAVDKCLADGYQVSAAVVDRGGNVRTLLRQDGAGPHTVDSSRKKAYTSNSLKRPTAELGALIAKMPAVQGLQHMNEDILLLGGGLPIKLAGEVLGGIGVGGAPGGHLDEACAEAGLISIGAASKPPEKK
ncbi:MAG: hypothetical protein NPINA01_32360 [Nitrospinaceae bacterium]|nr:MAG: hypothetical protein NPINA01_32360 [Nitrospinaceae bacterium]